jgi:cellobiose-specific phosphotransferase system component IIC
VLMIVNIAIATAIYMPFVRILERAELAKEKLAHQIVADVPHADAPL